MTEPDEKDLLAAEYVLGTLTAAERDAAAAQVAADADLARAVQDWEDRLAPLVDAMPEVAPPPSAFAAIASRLFGAPTGDAVSDAAVVVLRGRVRLWRGAAAGFALLAAALSVWIAVREGAPARDPQRFAAVLQRDAGAPAMLVDVDLLTRRLTVRPFAAVAPAGRAYELWIIAPALDAPRSLGLVPASGDAREPLGSLDPAVVRGATFAVTLEAAGGSTTGRPTGTPVLTGRLSPASP